MTARRSERPQDEYRRSLLASMTREERARALLAVATRLAEENAKALAELEPSQQAHARRLIARGYRVRKAIWTATRGR